MSSRVLTISAHRPSTSSAPKSALVRQRVYSGTSNTPPACTRIPHSPYRTACRKNDRFAMSFVGPSRHSLPPTESTREPSGRGIARFYCAQAAAGRWSASSAASSAGNPASARAHRRRMQCRATTWKPANQYQW